MRQIVFTLIFMLIGSAPAWAGNDNPDQLDVDEEFYSTSPRDASENHATINHGGYGGRANSAYGHVNSYSDEEFMVIFWDLYEPDTVSRRPERGRQSQGSYLRIGFSSWTWDDDSWDSTVVENCKAATKVRIRDGEQEAAWRVSCKGSMEAMGLSQDQLDRLERLLDRYTNTSRDGISISGRGPVDDD